MGSEAKSSPQAKRPISQFSLRSERLSISAKPGKILVVDDEPLIRSSVARALRSEGYEVIEAGSAEAALDLLMVHRQELSVLLSDVCLPGASGADLIGQARFLAPGLRTLLMSGTNRAHLVERAVIKPDTELLQKPFSISALLARLEQLLDLETREG